MAIVSTVLNKIVVAAATLAALVSCHGADASKTESSNAANAQELRTVAVSGDSLFSFVACQTALGPRTPGSKGHAECVKLVTRLLNGYGIDSVDVSVSPVTTWEGKRFTAQNIFAQINPQADRRILLLAHYDTRPWADNDADEANHSLPIDGANDGASGVAVLLEMARVLPKALSDSVGVDLLFTDMEDSGATGGDEDSWCLGVQEWVKNLPYAQGRKPAYGILLDMVGGRDAVFHREYYSQRHAGPVLDKVWSIARRSGFGEKFANTAGVAVVDDHIYINRAGIPCIDIIESMNSDTRSFNPTWHTMDDTLEAIDRETLRKVAQTVANTILN